MAKPIMHLCNTFNKTKATLKEFVYTWKITNFEIVHLGIEEYITSEVLNDEQLILWHVSLFPNGCDDQSKEYVGVDILFCKNTVGVKQSPYVLHVYLVDKNGKEHEIHTSSEIRKSTKEDEHIFIPKLFKRKDFLHPKKELFLNGDIILRFQIYLLNEEVITSKPINITSCASKTKLNPIKNIFNNEKFSDVQIVVDDKIFYVYKGILANQSPVFAAMFEHNMKENEENRVFISDIKHKVMHEVLRFMYAGNIVNKETIIVCDILAAADKYELEQLKILCEEILIKDLSITSVTSLSILAEKYRAKTLKASALEFFKLNAEEIIYTEEYKRDYKNFLSVLPEIIEILIS